MKILAFSPKASVCFAVEHLCDPGPERVIDSLFKQPMVHPLHAALAV
jgi:hypothetical protein